MCDHPFGNRRSRLRSQHRRLSSYRIIVRIPVVANLNSGLMGLKQKASAETTNRLTLLNNKEL